MVKSSALALRVHDDGLSLLIDGPVIFRIVSRVRQTCAWGSLHSAAGFLRRSSCHWTGRWDLGSRVDCIQHLNKGFPSDVPAWAVASTSVSLLFEAVPARGTVGRCVLKLAEDMQ